MVIAAVFLKEVQRCLFLRSLEVSSMSVSDWIRCSFRRHVILYYELVI